MANISKPAGGGVGGGGGWRFGGGGGGCDPLLPHAYLKGACVSGPYLILVSGMPMAGACESNLLPEVAYSCACARGCRM